MWIIVVIYYILIFTIGTLIGSFLTLAIHRIPLKQDILIKRSYCPKCEHKLTFMDLIPVWSYIFLRGKCRHCKNKIRPRYLIIEITCGAIALVIGVIISNILLF